MKPTHAPPKIETLPRLFDNLAPSVHFGKNFHVCHRFAQHGTSKTSLWLTNEIYEFYDFRDESPRVTGQALYTRKKNSHHSCCQPLKAQDWGWLWLIILKIFDSDTKDPTNTDQVLCTLPWTRRKEDGSSTENCKKLTRHTQRQRRNDRRERAPSPESTHPQRHAGSGMAQGGRGHAQTLATTIPVGGVTSTERGHSCPSRMGFAVRHFS